MVARNPNFAKLPAGYLFPEINRRKKALLEKRPDARIISLGIGNTTEPLTPAVAGGLVQAAERLGTAEGYSGYGDEQGLPELRTRIAETLYQGLVSPEEITISDGSKCDIGRLQFMFGKVSVAVQDPSYPVYVDGSFIVGADTDLQRLICAPGNAFFPDLARARRADLIYFCSPNNPTGAVADREQLAALVEFARRHQSIIVFDAAYSEYITDEKLPRSIYEIPGAEETAIEVNSFSKSVGFTGVRLGWCVVPRKLKFADGTPVWQDWTRVITTLFNGASNIAQRGGLAALTEAGRRETRKLIAYYQENARIILEGLRNSGIQTFGGVNAPYIWAHFPGQKSWDVFTKILNEACVVTTPGAGFGAAGEGFLRLSAFGQRADVREAMRRLRPVLAG
ncbi:LL-diaminopimelate aminotransferase [Candidatus Termititenax persephonae]|uniref:LL-diaminopimelate aminotransferase n=1 Tax=Candidatus Termititenax persephonae TaxID=2218525 RepID=A0A388TGL9_9BACT|nr:LL-diaminopimelate aminotransferase [Candidatus Termititenax persephonae]